MIGKTYLKLEILKKKKIPFKALYSYKDTGKVPKTFEIHFTFQSNSTK